MRFLLNQFLLILLFTIFSFQTLQAQRNSDCQHAQELFLDKSLEKRVADIAPKGFGAIQEIHAPARDIWFFTKEHHTAWYSFDIPETGLLMMEITPVDVSNDYDFILIQANQTAICQQLFDKNIKPVRSVISRNDRKLESKTGLADGYEQTHIHSGPGESYAKPLEVQKGQRYYLVLDNVYGGGKGHEITIQIKPVQQPTAPVASISRPVRRKIVPINRSASTFEPYLAGNVRDSKTQELLDVFVSLEKVVGKVLIDTAITDSGRFAMQPLLSTSEEYQFTVEKEGYLPNSLVFSYEDYLADSSRQFDLQLVPVEKGAAAVFKHLNFLPATADLYQESLPYLDELVNFMKSNPNVKVEISGHVDGTYALSSDSTFLQDLSDQRAEAIRDHLIESGIKASRLVAKGYSFSRMLYEKAITDDEMKANRRVEIEILEN